MTDLFDIIPPPSPLADRIRPRSLDDILGQEHLLGKGKILRIMIENKNLSSLIFWGPPGSGKTSLASILAYYFNYEFIAFSAVTSGIKEIKEVIKKATDDWRYESKRTILFIDEIHRFNKSQQDAFLPHVENGTIILIGATTQNPSFEIISPLLSRSRVLQLYPLKKEELVKIMNRAVEDEKRGLKKVNPSIEQDELKLIATFSSGDARVALNILELAVINTVPDNKGLRHVTRFSVLEAMQKKTYVYDKSGDEHYNLISALHKSMRGSDPDGSLYWLSRMLEAGEDPLYLARRMIRFASEDIGNADPQALQVAIAAMQAFHFVGLPEGKLALAQAAVYLSCAPKSNAVYKAYNEVEKEVKEKGYIPVPLHLRNAPTKLMKDLGFGKDYKYPHDYPSAQVNQEYLPGEFKGRTFYHPTDRGFEKEIKRRLLEWKKAKGR
ncbi:MAG: replication-associated recombination protein A [Thermodesulfobacteriota bacterium]|nr:replication-associated recombination protein A [Thermodesulfobacteriota bacterium]